MLTRAHHFPLPLIATATRILFSSRTFSSKSSLLFIPHAFSHDEAVKKSLKLNNAEYLPQRRKMMQQWADYLDALMRDAKKSCK